MASLKENYAGPGRWPAPSEIQGQPIPWRPLCPVEPSEGSQWAVPQLRDRGMKGNGKGDVLHFYPTPTMLGFFSTTLPLDVFWSLPRLTPYVTSLTASWLMPQPHADKFQFPGTTDLFPDIHSEVFHCLRDISIRKSNKDLKFNRSKTKILL